MKKISFLGVLLFILLAGCSSDEQVINKKEVKVEQATETTLQKETKKVSFEKPFKVITSINPNKAAELKMTVSNYEIVQGKSTVAEDNEQYDYVQFDVSYENTGKMEAQEMDVQNYSFKFYDENGVEIETENLIKDNLQGITFKEAAVRPGGKNKGTLIIPIPKGSVPGEMVYLSNWMSIMGSNEYVFKIK